MPSWCLILCLVIALGGCRTGYPIKEPARAGTPNAKLVHRVDDYASEFKWRWSGYWNMFDIGWPWFNVISADGTACPAWEHEVDVPLRGNYYECRTKWRIWRKP